MTGVRSWVLFGVTLALLAGATAMFLSVALRGIHGSIEESVPGEALYREVMGRAMREHVDPVDVERAVYGAMKGLVSELDPHSRVFDPVEWAEFQRDSRGELLGIGVEVVSLDGGLVVGWVAPDSPADRAGIQPGDHVVNVAGRATRDDRDGVLAALRGAAGARVDLVVADHESGRERPVSVTRATFEVSTVRARLLPGTRLAYVRVSAFRPHTADSFDGAVRDLPLEDVAGLIVDLRFNRGGAFNASVSLADRWIQDGVIVRTRGPLREDVERAHAEAPLAAIPTAILVNGATASAAEVFAGALQDTHAAVILGERTFGKGVVQDIYEFESWPGGMKLTTARYFTPAGRSIDRGMAAHRAGQPASGILPDVIVSDGSPADTLELVLQRDAYPVWLRNALARQDGTLGFRDAGLDAAVLVLTGGSSDRPLGSPSPSPAPPERPK